MFDPRDAQAQQESAVQCDQCDAGVLHGDCPLARVRAKHHWIVGGGSVGCLYDYGPDACETLDDAIDALAGVYDLTTAEKNQLRWHKYLSFDREPGSALEDESGGLSRYHEAGADYCEITCHDGPCPEPEDE